MEIKLKINGSDKRIVIKPENRSDKKLLEFVAEHDMAKLDIDRDYRMGGRDEIKGIELLLRIAPVEKSPK